ncbi:MAG: hypothetical protein AAF570_11130, partial [Bacteroidota bacterium]
MSEIRNESNMPHNPTSAPQYIRLSFHHKPSACISIRYKQATAGDALIATETPEAPEFVGFAMIPIERSAFVLVNQYTGLMLGASGPSTLRLVNYKTVQQEEEGDPSELLWFKRPVSEGFYLENKGNGNCITADIRAGGGISLSTFAEKPNQILNISGEGQAISVPEILPVTAPNPGRLIPQTTGFIEELHLPDRSEEMRIGAELIPFFLVQDPQFPQLLPAEQHAASPYYKLSR